MSTDTIAVLLVLGMAPPATLFPIIYGLSGPWYRTPIGRALMTKAVGLALLVDISLLYNWLGDDYWGREAVRLTVFSLIFCGLWMQFGALLSEKWRACRGHRHSAFDSAPPD